MVRKKTVFLLGALLAAGIPVAGASGSCDGAPYTDPDVIEVAGRYYVQEKLTDGQMVVNVYAETNGLPGFQPGHTPCGYGQPMIRPDTQIATLSRTL